MVVTNAGFSDWSTMDIPSSISTVSIATWLLPAGGAFSIDLPQKKVDLVAAAP